MHLHPCENDPCARACAGLLKEFIADKSFPCVCAKSALSARAFFVVGLHPGASRLARRTPMPCLVFNLHEQFEQLKASGK